jgi:hypothetical protein
MSLAYCWKDWWWRGRGAVYSRWIVRFFHLPLIDLVLIISMNIADLAGVSRVRDTSYVPSVPLDMY